MDWADNISMKRWRLLRNVEMYYMKKPKCSPQVESLVQVRYNYFPHWLDARLGD